MAKRKPDYNKMGKMKGKKAQKNHLIAHNTFKAEITKGMDLEKIPDMFESALKVEGVL